MVESSLPAPLTAPLPANGFWVFGYGSLMWRPGFPFEERVEARLVGAHRSLCVISVHHRGTAERPGLVLGLDRGGSCRGIAFRVAPERGEEVVAYLREREQVTSVYVEAWRPVRLVSGEMTTALTYLVDRNHPQYAGVLPIETITKMVGEGKGLSGDNIDYVMNSWRHLAQLGIADPVLSALAEKFGSRGEGGRPGGD